LNKSIRSTTAESQACPLYNYIILNPLRYSHNLQESSKEHFLLGRKFIADKLLQEIKQLHLREMIPQLTASESIHVSNNKNISKFQEEKMKRLNSMDAKSVDFKAARKESSVHKLLNYDSLDQIRRAYSAALQTQLYTRNMIGRISKGDFSATLDKSTKYDLGDDLKKVYANLVPYEM